jgi:hypothetical protein
MLGLLSWACIDAKQTEPPTDSRQPPTAKASMYRAMDISERAKNIQQIAYQLDVLEGICVGPFLAGGSGVRVGCCLRGRAEGGAGAIRGGEVRFDVWHTKAHQDQPTNQPTERDRQAPSSPARTLPCSRRSCS